MFCAGLLLSIADLLALCASVEPPNPPSNHLQGGKNDSKFPKSLSACHGNQGGQSCRAAHPDVIRTALPANGCLYDTANPVAFQPLGINPLDRPFRVS